MKWAPKSRKLLGEQRITPEGPGTILNDVRVLLDYLGTRELRTGSKQGNLPAVLLPDINARLSSPVEVYLARPLLRDYPNIAGLYILLRVLELVRADGPKLRVDEVHLTAWNALNLCEQYFALLEAWLLKADGQVLGGTRQRDAEGLADLLLWLGNNVGPRWRQFDECVHVYGIGCGGPISAWNIQLMIRLGLIEVVPRPLHQRGRDPVSRGWMMMAARRAPWGEAVTWAVFEQWAATANPKDTYFYVRPLAEDDFDVVRSAFRPFFPEYQKLFGSPEAVVIPGAYVFKVGFHPRYGPADVWRRLAVPHTASLYALCEAVLKAFDYWDDEHLHQFHYRDRTGRSRVYWHPDAREGPYSDEITLGETGLPEKQTMNFKFDFGNTSCFVLRLEQIAPVGAHRGKVTLIESCGAALKQYGGMGE